MTTSTIDNWWTARAHAALRIMSGLLFLEHGAMKLFGFPPSPNPGPALLSMLGGQGVLELAGGLLLILGLLARPVALILCGDMAAAYFIEHLPRSFFPALNGGDAAILFCFIFLYLAVAGAGAWSVDELRK
jgi:putative oxidoreductase